MIRIMGNEGDDSDRVYCDCDDDEKLASATGEMRENENDWMDFWQTSMNKKYAAQACGQFLFACSIKFSSEQKLDDIFPSVIFV